MGQQTYYQPKDPQLYKTIVHMGSVVFDAFNTHNLEVLKTVFAANLLSEVCDFGYTMPVVCDYRV